MKKMIALFALATALVVAQQNEDKVYKVGGDVTAPRVLQKVDPVYTPEASGGTVLLSLVVGADGVPRDIKMVRSMDPGMDARAIAALQAWKFQAGTKDGEPVSVRATIEMNFKKK